MTDKPVRKKLIEVSIPLEAINVASAREKSIRHGHPSTLHLWWARRPLAACRAVLFAQLVDDPSAWPGRYPFPDIANDEEAERRRLHKVIEAMVPWEASNNEPILNAARWEIARTVAWGIGEEPPTYGDGPAILNYLQTKAPPVYDPFSGGGSIPLEAQRLGLRAYGSDLNPVAVLIGKALVEIPPKFAGRPPVNPEARAEAANGQLRPWKSAEGLAEDVRYYGEWMRDEAEKVIGDVYPKAKMPSGPDATVIAWLWARTVRSPDPAAKGARVPLISTFFVSTKARQSSWVEVVADPAETDGWRFEVSHGRPPVDQKSRLQAGTIGRKGGICALTGCPISLSYIREEGRAGRLGKRLMCMVVDGPSGRIYLPPTPAQETAAEVEASDVDVLDQNLAYNPRDIKAPTYGLTTVSSLFTSRQLLALSTLARFIRDVRGRVIQDALTDGRGSGTLALSAGGDEAGAYGDSIATYLAFALSKLADRGSSICTWYTERDSTRPTFARQAIPMTWDFAELNTLLSGSGSFLGAVNWTAESISGSQLTVGSGRIENRDAALSNPAAQNMVVSTDPPYYDNIEYAELSDFFYCWLRMSLVDIWPELFRTLTTPKEGELVAAPYRHGGKEKAERFFMEGMSRAIKNIRDCIGTTDGVVTIYYAYKQSEIAEEGIFSAGWTSFLQSIVDAQLSIDGTWPIRTELANRMIARDANALASSIVLVCRKKAVDAPVVTRAEFIRVLKREMPTAIADIREAGVGPVDMQQSVIGPGMGVFSRHARVLEDDDSTMGVRAALTLINRVWEEIENELDQAFDPETQVALAWFATFGFDKRKSGELITLANAKNIPADTLFASGVFKDLKGDAALTQREDLPPSWSPATDKTCTVWECVQHTARVLNAPSGGGVAAAALVKQMGSKSADARALAYRLFEIATNKGWASEALIYNELAQEWTKLEDIAASLDSAGHFPGSGQAAFDFEGAA